MVLLRSGSHLLEDARLPKPATTVIFEVADIPVRQLTRLNSILGIPPNRCRGGSTQPLPARPSFPRGSDYTRDHEIRFSSLNLIQLSIYSLRQ